MTYRRVLNRNGLATGGYNPAGGNSADSKALLLGDLRRLEEDTVDEKATCLYISRKTGIDVETVAAVLKEFMAW